MRLLAMMLLLAPLTEYLTSSFPLFGAFPPTIVGLVRGLLIRIIIKNGPIADVLDGDHLDH